MTRRWNLAPLLLAGVLLVGVTIGFIIGARAVRKEMARMKERAKR